MAYMRTEEWYCWFDGENVHLNDLIVPRDVFDALVIMRWAQLREEQPENLTAMRNIGAMDIVMRQIAEEYEGNAGADALRRMFGMRTVMDEAREFAKQYRDDEG